MGFGEEIFEKSAECVKEAMLYTPSGAALLGEVSFIPGEVTHWVLIVCCPLVVLVIKGNRQHRKHHRELLLLEATHTE